MVDRRIPLFGLGGRWKGPPTATRVDTTIRDPEQLPGLELAGSFQRLQADLSFTEPRFLDMNMAAGFDIFAKQLDETKTSGFMSTKYGGSLRYTFNSPGGSAFVTFLSNAHHFSSQRISPLARTSVTMSGGCLASQYLTAC